MLRIGINGFGRIGRAFFRANHDEQFAKIVGINDVVSSPENMAYLLKYDSEYSQFSGNIEATSDGIVVNENKIKFFSESSIASVPWHELKPDIILDASGVHKNIDEAKKLVAESDSIQRVVFTHCNDKIEKTLIMGVNEVSFNPELDHIVSSGICDSVAISPVLKVMDEAFGIDSGFVTTLHPWLQYQNLLDGPAISWGKPGQVYPLFEVGRSTTRSLLPKPTSAVEAVLRSLPALEGKLQCMSFRVPTSIVGCANLYLHLKNATSLEEVKKRLLKAESDAPGIIECRSDPLVSIDYMKSSANSVFDLRWTALASPHHLFAVLWYDNEWGYAHHALRLIKFMESKVKN